MKPNAAKSVACRPVACPPPVGRATATLASLKKYLVREIGEARTRQEHYRIGGFKNQLNYNDGQKDALIGTLKWLEWNARSSASPRDEGGSIAD